MAGPVISTGLVCFFTFSFLFGFANVAHVELWEGSQHGFLGRSAPLLGSALLSHPRPSVLLLPGGNRCQDPSGLQHQHRPLILSGL